MWLVGYVTVSREEDSSWSISQKTSCAVLECDLKSTGYETRARLSPASWMTTESRTASSVQTSPAARLARGTQPPGGRAPSHLAGAGGAAASGAASEGRAAAAGAASCPGALRLPGAPGPALPSAGAPAEGSARAAAPFAGGLATPRTSAAPCGNSGVR